jgi:hypothetical protein
MKQSFGITVPPRESGNLIQNKLAASQNHSYGCFGSRKPDEKVYQTFSLDAWQKRRAQTLAI